MTPDALTAVALVLSAAALTALLLDAASPRRRASTRPRGRCSPAVHGAINPTCPPVPLLVDRDGQDGARTVEPPTPRLGSAVGELRSGRHPSQQQAPRPPGCEHSQGTGHQPTRTLVEPRQHNHRGALHPTRSQT